MEPLLKSLHNHSANVLDARMQDNTVESIKHNSKLIESAKQIERVLHELNDFSTSLSYNEFDVTEQTDDDILF